LEIIVMRVKSVRQEAVVKTDDKGGGNSQNDSPGSYGTLAVTGVQNFVLEIDQAGLRLLRMSLLSFLSFVSLNSTVFRHSFERVKNEKRRSGLLF
jgi:hypothetical protein